MAKGSAMGLWRGKKGSSVFYYLRNSNSREKQGIREYQPVVSNPQTSAQIDQRMYMTPAQNLYRELADIIRRSWQGLEYGGKGTQEFFKYALRHGTTRPVGIPWLDKGDSRAVPGTYQISNGSIAEVFATIIDADLCNTSLTLTITQGGNTTWGDVSTDLIENNDIKQGDQLTFVTCASSEEYPTASSRFGWDVFSIYVDTNSTTPLIQVFGKYTIVAIQDSKLSLQNNGVNPFPFLQAAAVIVSRLGSTGTYQRSPATIAVNTELMAYWYSANRHDLARNSYINRTGSTRSGSWIVDDQAGDSPVSREKVDGTFTLAGLTGDKADANGTNVRVQRYADDNSIAAVYVIATQSEGQTVYPLVNSANGQAVEYAGTGGAFGYIFPSDQAELTGKTTIIVG